MSASPHQWYKCVKTGVKRFHMEGRKRVATGGEPPARLHPHLDRPRGDRVPLPSALTSFVGREREIDAIAATLRRRDVRLVSLCGPGGVGKTRLAIAVSARLLEDYADGVGFVDLGLVSDPDAVRAAIAHSLGIPEADQETAGDRLKAYLADRQRLLVIDNFEQVVGAGPILTDLLSSCLLLSMLVTSQRALDVYGEHVYTVQPLSLTGGERRDVRSDDTVPEAVLLFAERARAVLPDFTLDTANMAAVTAICEQLEGLPLAIELAAARVGVLPPDMLAARLSHRLPWLTGGPRDAPTRLQTMRNAIDWSYGLLDGAEQAAFRRLALFVGGSTLEAAESVIGGLPGERATLAATGQVDSLDTMVSLVRGSFLRQSRPANGKTRFAMLETMREYGIELLRELEEEEAARNAHARYFLQLAEEAEREIWGADQARWLDRLEAELGNLRAALSWFIESDPAGALRMVGVLWPFWRIRFYAREGFDWAQRALQAESGETTSERANALLGAGTLAWAQGDYRAAVSHFESALTSFAQLHDPIGESRTLLAFGRLAWDQGDIDLARERFDVALPRFERAGNDLGSAMCLHGLALVAFKTGEDEVAVSLFVQAQTTWNRLGFEWGLNCCIPGHLADLARRQGKHDDAVALYRQSLKLNWQARDRENISWNLIGLASVAVERNHSGPGAELLGAALAVREAIGAPLMPDEQRDYDRAAANARSALGYAAFEAALETGRALSLADLVAGSVTVAIPPPATFDMAVETERGEEVDELTSRELEILRLVVAGWRDKDIADELFISFRTVQTHLVRVFRKLHVRSRAAAAAVAVRRGLV